VPTPQPVSSPPRLPCRSLGPGPSVPSPSCPEPRLSRVPKLTPAHNTPHEAIPRLFYPQAAPATDSYFTHDQAQPHQSTALLRVAMDHHLTTQAAFGSPLHSALFQPSRARPQQHAVCEIQQRPGPVEAAADALMQLDAGLNSDADQLGCGGRRAVLAGASRRGRCGAFEMQPRRVDVGESHPALDARAIGREASSPPGG